MLILVGLKRWTLYFFIVVISIALLGLLGIQFYFYHQTIDYKRQLFEQNVKFSLKTSAHKIQKIEFFEHLKDSRKFFDLPGHEGLRRAPMNIQIKPEGFNKKDSLFESQKFSDIQVRRDKSKKGILKIIDEKNTNRIIFQKIYEDSKNKKQFFEEIEGDLKRMNVDLKHRINPKLIDSILDAEFTSNGILLPYVFEVVSEKSNNVVYASGKQGRLIFNEKLYPNDVFGEQGVLRVSFPNQMHFMHENFSLIVFSSLSFLMILVGVFSFIIVKMIQQRKISLLKTDFINNMTHEFKTPVSTIMLASEALIENKKDIINSRLNNLVEVINKENNRLLNHIERVLNMTRLEKEDFQLDKKIVDLHQLILLAIEALQIQIENKNAKIFLNLNAKNPEIVGDATHLQNVFINLIDNSLKYSLESPEFTISSEETEKSIVLRFKDNGIGIKKEIQSKIFDKFIREEMGNVHTIKGFGLGLSYVKSVLDKMGGKISLKSEKYKGAEFVIEIPKLRTI